MCQGFGACLCNIILLLKPPWINNLPTPQQKCKGGNIFGLLVKKIVQLIARTADDAINNIIVRPINAIIRGITLGFVKNAIPEACISGPFNPPRYDCQYGAFNDIDLLGCYDGAGIAAQHACYFERQRAICLDNSDRYARYQDLFEAPDVQQLDTRFQNIVGESFSFLHPAFKDLMQQASQSTQDFDVVQAKELCDASLFESMDLDEVRATARSLAHECDSRKTCDSIGRLLWCASSRSSRASAQRPTPRSGLIPSSESS